jgi:DNA-binding HxlR family transcriptional regulator
MPTATEPQTSKAAANSVAQIAGSLRLKVLNHIRTKPNGATCDEVEQDLSMLHQTASARCRELVQMGLLEKRTDPSTGKENQRPTRSGRSASVLYVKEPVLASVSSSKGPSLSPVAKALQDAFVDAACGSDPTCEFRKGLAAALRALADLTEYPWVVDCETLYIHPEEVRSIAFAFEQFNG